MKYTIFKGFHYSLPIIPKIIKIDSFRKNFIVNFSTKCFEAKTNEDCAVNKLFGWTNGLSLKGTFINKSIIYSNCFINKKYKNFVHTNSFRIGRTIENGNIQLWSYIYNNGILEKKKLNDAIIPKEYGNKDLLFTIDYSIYKDKSNLILTCYNENKIYLFSCLVKVPTFKKYGWWLTPYHGGVKSSPNKYSIKIKKIWIV